MEILEFLGIKPTLTWLFQIELLTQVVKKLRYNRVNCILLCQTITVNYSICLWLVFIFDGCYIFNHNILINLKRNNGLWKTWTVQVQLYSSDARPWSTIIQYDPPVPKNRTGTNGKALERFFSSSTNLELFTVGTVFFCENSEKWEKRRKTIEIKMVWINGLALFLSGLDRI